MTAASLPMSHAATTATRPVIWPVTAPIRQPAVAVVEETVIVVTMTAVIAVTVETVVSEVPAAAVACLATIATRAGTSRVTAQMAPSRATAVASWAT